MRISFKMCFFPTQATWLSTVSRAVTSVSTCRVDAGRRRVKRSGSVARSTPTLVWQRSTRASGHWPAVSSALTQISVRKDNSPKHTMNPFWTSSSFSTHVKLRRKKNKNKVLYFCKFQQRVIDKSVPLTFSCCRQRRLDDGRCAK